jgi:DNA (cytosine-5)-methyltransferase 1
MITLFDAFAGYGGAHFSLKKSKIPHKTVGFSEIDKHAIYIYRLNHGNITNFGDITVIDSRELPDFNFFSGGFPCQPFSQAGKRKGINDTRGTLFHDIIRICKDKKPDNILLENVQGLMTKRHQKTLKIIQNKLKSLGYSVHIELLNSLDYGIPQSRKRVWIYASKKKIPKSFKLAPQKKPLFNTLPHFLDQYPSKELYRSQEQIKKLIKRYKVDFNVSKRSCVDLYNYKVRNDGICATITEPHHNTLRIVEPPKNGKFRVRKLSPREHFKLMGFKSFSMYGKKSEIKVGDRTYSQVCARAGNGWDINIASIVIKNIYKFYYDS